MECVGFSIVGDFCFRRNDGIGVMTVWGQNPDGVSHQLVIPDDPPTGGGDQESP